MYAKYVNGMQLRFTDTDGGPVGNFPFRLYTSKLMATLDSAAFAWQAGVSDAGGTFSRYNVPAARYYIVASVSIPPVTLKVLDSVAVPATGIGKNANVQVK